MIVQAADDQVTDYITHGILRTTPESSCDSGLRCYRETALYAQSPCLMKAPEGLPDMPEFGMLFKFDADYENLTWYGYGGRGRDLL